MIYDYISNSVSKSLKLNYFLQCVWAERIFPSLRCFLWIFCCKPPWGQSQCKAKILFAQWRHRPVILAVLLHGVKNYIILFVGSSLSFFLIDLCFFLDMAEATPPQKSTEICTNFGRSSHIALLPGRMPPLLPPLLGRQLGICLRSELWQCDW